MRNFGRDLLFAAAVFVVCLALTESFLRLFFPIHPSIYQPDNVLLHRLVPEGKRIFVHSKENGGGKVTVSVNSLGFRGEDFALRKGTGRKRVVVYGDSFVEADFSTVDKTFVKRLERRLNEDGIGNPVEVINAGVNAYGPDQELLKMQQDLDTLKPDLVVVAVFAGNDYGDLIRDKIFRLDERGELQKNNYVLRESLRSWMMGSAFPGGLERLQIAIRLRQAYENFSILRVGRKNSSASAGIPDRHALIEDDLARVEKDYEDFVVSNNNEVGNLFADAYDVDVAVNPDAPSSLYKIRLMEKVIARMSHVADSADVSMVLLIVPCAVDVCDNYYYQVDPDKFRRYKRSRPTDILEDIAVRHRIVHLNLFPILREADARKYYFHHANSHWNDAGQDFAAGHMARLILDKKLL